MKGPKLICAMMLRRITRILFLGAAVLGMVTTMPGQPSPQATASTAAFKQLASLVGEWEAIQENVPVKETYTLTAKGSVLMSETKPAGSEPMITMFTVDGDHLIATHYCIAGNQPQMVTQSIGDLEKDGLTFSFARVTGMKTPEDWHNTDLMVKLDDKDHMTQRWSYLYKGKTGTTIFHYTRKK